MPDLNQIKQAEQEARDGAGGSKRGWGNSADRPRGSMNREEGGSGMQFAADSLQITARTAGRHGPDRLASHELELISDQIVPQERPAD
jgi:hypothetical protein